MVNTMICGYATEHQANEYARTKSKELGIYLSVFFCKNHWYLTDYYSQA